MAEVLANLGQPSASGKWDWVSQYHWVEKGLLYSLVTNVGNWFDHWIGKDPLEEGMAIHSSVLAWRIPWTEEPGGLQFMGSQRVSYEWNDMQVGNWDSVHLVHAEKLCGRPPATPSPCTLIEDCLQVLTPGRSGGTCTDDSEKAPRQKSRVTTSGSGRRLANADRSPPQLRWNQSRGELWHSHHMQLSPWGGASYPHRWWYSGPVRILCYGGFPVHCKMFSSIPGLPSLDTSCPLPSCYNLKCL